MEVQLSNLETTKTQEHATKCACLIDQNRPCPCFFALGDSPSGHRSCPCQNRQNSDLPPVNSWVSLKKTGLQVVGFWVSLQNPLSRLGRRPLPPGSRSAGRWWSWGLAKRIRRQGTILEERLAKNVRRTFGNPRAEQGADESDALGHVDGSPENGPF